MMIKSIGISTISNTFGRKFGGDKMVNVVRILTLCLILGFRNFAVAQETDTNFIPQANHPSVIDEFGVNLFTGSFKKPLTDITIGHDQRSSFNYIRYGISGKGIHGSLVFGVFCEEGGRSARHGCLDGDQDRERGYYVQNGEKKWYFDAVYDGATNTMEYKPGKQSDPLISLIETQEGTPGPKSHTAAGFFGDFTFTDRDGTQYFFSGQRNRSSPPQVAGSSGRDQVRHADLYKIVYPDGTTILSGYGFASSGSQFDVSRALRQNLQNNLGYSFRATQRSMINLTNTYCDINAEGCSAATNDIWPQYGDFPTKNYVKCEQNDGCSPKKIVETSKEGRVVHYQYDQTPADWSFDRIETTEIGSDVWTYNWGPCHKDDAFCTKVIRTAPDGQKEVYNFVYKYGQLESYEVIPKNGSTGSLITQYSYKRSTNTSLGDGTLEKRLLETITYPMGNLIKYTYDDFDRITEIRKTPKPGSNLPDMVSSYTYDDCTSSNRKWCIKPRTVTDERGKVSKYKYYDAHGGVDEVTSPHVSGIGYHKTKTEYTQLHAWYRTSSSATQVRDNRPVWRKTKEISCVVSSESQTCSDVGAYVQVTEYKYKQGNASTPSNLQLVEVITRSGDSSVYSSVTYDHDTWGRVIWEDGPLPGSADRVWYEYDKRNNITRETRADPDGSGPQTYTYVRREYNLDDQLTLEESGRTTGPYSASSSDTALASTSYLYDVYGRQSKVIALDMSSGQVSLTQTSYDASSRVDCVALRMDLSTYGSLPASACTQTASGQDRITKTEYDAYGRAYKTTRGLGTSVVMNEQKTFTNNSLEKTVKDGNGNVTTFSYDGLDRLYKTEFPSTTTGSGTSNTGDKIVLLYEDQVSGGNASPLVRQERKRSYDSEDRDEDYVESTYDDMGRVTWANTKDTKNDVTTTYDVFGNVKTLTKDNKAITYAWDALGRLKSETIPLAGGNKTVGYNYDTAGRLTRVTHPDGFYVDYIYWDAGGLKEIRENGSKVLASYAYDSFGRPQQLTFGNGITRSLDYNDAGQISDLDIGVANDNDYNLEVDYDFNVASQITSKIKSNLIYRPEVSAKTNSYGVNGLNQITNENGTSFSHDANGNLTNDGVTGYSYDIFNRLTSVNNGTSLDYDADGRLYSISKSNDTTYFLYAGTALIGEYDANGTLLRRYVHGLDVDTPIVWYEGSAANDNTRRYMIRDELGSVALVADNSGQAIQHNTYDEYGVPNPDNLGRFQYTGQTWLNEAELYYYKARVYNPRLGRFMQTDPIGYADGLNWYAYVGNDPINNTDPSGEFANFIAKFVVDVAIEVAIQAASGQDINLGTAAKDAALGMVNPAKTVQRAKKLAKIVKKTTCCFVAGTLVETEDGLRPIEDIKIGDLVLARDDTTGETELKTVTDLIQRHNRIIWDVELAKADDEIHTFRTTDDHPWWVSGIGWTNTDELYAGMSISTADGLGVRVISVKKTSDTEPTYNLTVADFETYFVGKQGVWVHNCRLRTDDTVFGTKVKGNEKEVNAAVGAAKTENAFGNSKDLKCAKCKLEGSIEARTKEQKSFVERGQDKRSKEYREHQERIEFEKKKRDQIREILDEQDRD